MTGKLTLVPTPVGNLKDITFRAVEVLKEVDVILTEDTRKSGILLNKYEIKNTLIPHHKYNEHKTAKNIAERISKGENMALITDAGTPSISDPGYLLVNYCIEKNTEVECLPGATAFLPALAISGLPNDKFVFEGFLPHKKGRQKRLKELQSEERTIVFYESPYRINKLLKELKEHFGNDRPASVSREISKQYEETIRGDLEYLSDYFEKSKAKGEFVIIISGKNILKKQRNESDQI